MMTEMDESEVHVAIQAVDEVQKDLEQMKDSSSRCLKASYMNMEYIL